MWSYFDRLYYEYQAWTLCDPRPEKSPIELPFNLFNSMTNAVAKIGNAILNEYGAGKEWKECRRLTKRIWYLIQCINDMEMAVLEGNNMLETRHTQGKLLYQDKDVQHWVNRAHARVYIQSLDEQAEKAHVEGKEKMTNTRLSPAYSFTDLSAEEVEVANRVEAEEAERQRRDQQRPAEQASASISGTSTPLASPRKRVFQPTANADPSIRRVAKQRAEQQLVANAATHMQVHSDSPGPFDTSASGNAHSVSPGPFGNPASGMNAYPPNCYPYPYPSYQPGAHYLSSMQPGMQPGMQPYMQPGMQPVLPPLQPLPPAQSASTAPSTSTVVANAPPMSVHPVADISLTSNHSPPVAISTAEAVPAAPEKPRDSPVPVADTPLALVPDLTSSTKPSESQSTKGIRPQPRAASSGGRPSQDDLRALEDLRTEFDAKVQALSNSTGLTIHYIHDFLVQTVKGQRDLNTWNKFQPYALDDDNFKREIVERLAGTSCPHLTGIKTDTTSVQIETAYHSFMAEHGIDDAKVVLAFWHDAHEVETTQTKGSRKRIFNTAVSQVTSLAKTMRNKHSIYVYCLMTGGIIGTDQELSAIVQLGESQGFANTGFLFGDIPLQSMFKAHITDGLAVTYTNNQLAAIARERGLTLTGRGIDELAVERDIPKGPTNIKGAASGSGSTKIIKATSSATIAKPKDRHDILALVKGRLAEDIGSFSKKGTALYWATLAEQCLQDGVQITGYPPNANYPWSLLKLPPNERTCGIKSMSKDDQDLIIQACIEPKGSEYRLGFSRVTSADLEHDRVPILITAPDEDGEKTEVLFSDLTDFLKPKKMVHFKTEDVAIAVISKNAAARADDDEFDELASSTSGTEDEAPTPQAKKGQGQPAPPKKTKGIRSKICSAETIEDSDEMLSGSMSTTSPSKAHRRTRNQSSRSAGVTATTASSSEQPKVVRKSSSGQEPGPKTTSEFRTAQLAAAAASPTKPAPPQKLTMDDLKDGDFKPLNLSTKRPAQVAEETSSAKKKKPNVSPAPPTPGAHAPLAAAQPMPTIVHRQLPPSAPTSTIVVGPPSLQQGASSSPPPVPHSTIQHHPSIAIAGPPSHHLQPHQGTFSHSPYWQYPAYLPQQAYPHPHSQNPTAFPLGTNPSPMMQSAYVGVPSTLPPWTSMTPEQQHKMQEYYNSLAAQPQSSAGGSGQQQ
ncbi:hypothetical protein PM082_021691 [Marasmius tenuissimus]|nr:hypothetical protein PM082_021691 [Marasmius tenuissimus]